MRHQQAAQRCKSHEFPPEPLELPSQDFGHLVTCALKRSLWSHLIMLPYELNEVVGCENLSPLFFSLLAIFKLISSDKGRKSTKKDDFSFYLLKRNGEKNLFLSGKWGAFVCEILLPKKSWKNFMKISRNEIFIFSVTSTFLSGFSAGLVPGTPHFRPEDSGGNPFY